MRLNKTRVSALATISVDIRLTARQDTRTLRLSLLAGLG